MRTLTVLAALLLSSSVFASGYGGYDQEPVEVAPVVITVKGTAAATCQESKEQISASLSVTGCYDKDESETNCKCEETKESFSCVYTKKVVCTPEYELL